MSFYEIYQERIYDLLNSDPRSASKRGGLGGSGLSVKPLPFSDKRVVAGLSAVKIESVTDAIAFIDQGLKNRQSFKTDANASSSRSHGVVSIGVWSRHKSETRYRQTDLNIVDLAGSERTQATKAEGDRLAEAGYINRSLMMLGQCLAAMRDQDNKVSMHGMYVTLATSCPVSTNETHRAVV